MPAGRSTSPDAVDDATTRAPDRERLAAAGVHTLLVQFTDLAGVAKGKWVPLAQLDEVFSTGAGFAGPSIAGTGLPRQGPRSEYYARGDSSTLQPLPWAPGVARLVGDGFVAGAPFEGCPRQVLRRAVERLSARDLELQVGLEPEFFLLRRVPGSDRLVPADPLDGLAKPSYDLHSLPRQRDFLWSLRQGLEACGLEILQIDHEDANGQFELNFRHAGLLAGADRLMLFKLGAQALAEARGLVFSTMPKPFADQPGSGLHVHASLWQAGRNVFEPGAGEPYDAATPLSATGRHFVAGVLAHSAGLCALAAPTVNSYRRLAAGGSRSGTTWAPVHVAHGPNNRTALVRTLPGRFEWRLPDAAANPYLMLAGLVAAGLDGLDRRLEPPPAREDDLYELSAEARRAAGLQRVPRSLDEALDALEQDAVLADALGAHTHREFLRLKRDEWDDWARHVGEWEHRRYGAA